jgi:hypothetical protein
MRKIRKIVLDQDEITMLYTQEGWPASRIGEKYDVWPQTVTRYLRSWGVPLRTQIASRQPLGRRPCPESLPLRAYALGFVWGDLAVAKASPGSMTISVTGSTTHDEQVDVVTGLFSPFGPVKVSRLERSVSLRASLDLSWGFLFDKYGALVPEWIRGFAAEAAFAAGYIDAEGSFGVYEGRARFKVDSYDAQVLAWLADWMGRCGVLCRHRRVARAGDARQAATPFPADLWRINVNESFSILRLAATLEPFLRHERRRARMTSSVVNIQDRLRARVPD